MPRPNPSGLIGHVRANGVRTVSIQFEDDMARRIMALAAENRSSFGEQVRTMLSWALDTVEEDE